MTKKKRDLIEILLDNVNPEDWPKNLPFAAQDKCSLLVNCYFADPVISSIHNHQWTAKDKARHNIFSSHELCKHWNKTIVHRDEFMKRWNERNPVEVKTLTFSREGIESFTATENMEKITIKPEVDSEGWIQWNGGEMPVEKGTLIDVKYRIGLINLHVNAGEYPSGGSVRNRYAIEFKHDDNLGDIIAYRLHAPQQQKTPQQLALEKFGTDWHDNEGVQPFSDASIKIDLEFKVGVIRENVNVQASSFKIPFDTEGFTVTKWRIHSDEKEANIVGKENTLELMRKPMPECSEEIPCHFVDVKSTPSTQIGGIEKVISDRGSNYGRFEDGAEIMQQLKLIAHTSKGWERMKPIQREGMDMILHKIGRILNGDPSYVENYTDIAGYAKLVIDFLLVTEGSTDAEVIYKKRVGGEWVEINR